MISLLSSGCITGDTSSNLSLISHTGQNSILLKDGVFKWFTTPMTDIQSKKTLTIYELISAGKPVIIHTFAVWCPACTIQLGETTRLLYDYPGEYTMIAIDADPHEAEETVSEHILINAFEGYFVSAPVSVSREMIRDLGTGVTLSLPQTIIISGGRVRTLGSGVFRESELRAIIADNSIPQFDRTKSEYKKNRLIQNREILPNSPGIYLPPPNSSR